MAKNRVKTEEKKIEDVLDFFVWDLNLDMNKADPKAIKNAGFKDLKEACQFWQKNKAAFRPFLGGNQEGNIEQSVNETLRLIG